MYASHFVNPESLILASNSLLKTLANYPYAGNQIIVILVIIAIIISILKR